MRWIIVLSVFLVGYLFSFMDLYLTRRAQHLAVLASVSTYCVPSEKLTWVEWFLAEDPWIRNEKCKKVITDKELARTGWIHDVPNPVYVLEVYGTTLLLQPFQVLAQTVWEAYLYSAVYLGFYLPVLFTIVSILASVKLLQPYVPHRRHPIGLSDLEEGPQLEDAYARFYRALEEGREQRFQLLQ